MVNFVQKQFSEEDKHLFLSFICQIEGWKTKCKNLHWAAPKKNIHEYLDAFLEVLSSYQDTLAETYMGILGQMGPDDVEGLKCSSRDAMDFIDEVSEMTQKFYERIPEGTEFKGITGETESLIKDIQKYKYLFGLCF